MHKLVFLFTVFFFAAFVLAHPGHEDSHAEVLPNQAEFDKLLEELTKASGPEGNESEVERLFAQIMELMGQKDLEGEEADQSEDKKDDKQEKKGAESADMEL